MLPEPPAATLELRHAATDRALIVEVPTRRFLAIDGVGPPDAADFQHAAATLREVAETLRARLARERGVQTRVGVLECAWWIHPELPPDETAEAFVERSAWHWQLMIEIPGVASDDDVRAAIDRTRSRAGRTSPLVRTIEIREGLAAQILHVGGPAGEPDSVRKLYRAIAESGLRPRGHLHQILLVDPRQVPEHRARSILRLPVEPTT